MSGSSCSFLSSVSQALPPYFTYKQCRGFPAFCRLTGGCKIRDSIRAATNAEETLINLERSIASEQTPGSASSDELANLALAGWANYQEASEAVGWTAAPSTHCVQGATPTAETGVVPENTGVIQGRMEAPFTYPPPVESSPCYGRVCVVGFHEIHRETLRGTFGCLNGQALFPEKFMSS